MILTGYPTPRGQDSYERRNRKTMDRIAAEGGDMTLPTRVMTMMEGAMVTQDDNPNATSEARVQRLKGYGNAIVAPAAVAWIETVMEVVDE